MVSGFYPLSAPTEANCLAESSDLNTLVQFVGNIIVDSTTWKHEFKLRCFRRANKDAEVQALCLLAYWLNNEDFNVFLSDMARKVVVNPVS